MLSRRRLGSPNSNFGRLPRGTLRPMLKSTQHSYSIRNQDWILFLFFVFRPPGTSRRPWTPPSTISFDFSLPRKQGGSFLLYVTYFSRWSFLLVSRRTISNILIRFPKFPRPPNLPSRGAGTSAFTSLHTYSKPDLELITWILLCCAALYDLNRPIQPSNLDVFFPLCEPGMSYISISGSYSDLFWKTRTYNSKFSNPVQGVQFASLQNLTLNWTQKSWFFSQLCGPRFKF